MNHVLTALLRIVGGGGLPVQTPQPVLDRPGQGPPVWRWGLMGRDTYLIL